MARNNSAELNAIVMADISVALEMTMNELLTKLQDYIQSDVYDVHSDSDRPWEINRTDEFKDSWERSNVVVSGSTATSQIFENTSIMQQVMKGGHIVHEDAETLAEIINSGHGYNFGQMEGTARPYWDNFVNYVESNLNEIFMKYCKQQGVSITYN